MLNITVITKSKKLNSPLFCFSKNFFNNISEDQIVHLFETVKILRPDMLAATLVLAEYAAGCLLIAFVAVSYVIV